MKFMNRKKGDDLLPSSFRAIKRAWLSRPRDFTGGFTKCVHPE